MNVTQYTFQSPYSSQVQVGRPDPNSQKADSSLDSGSEPLGNTNQTLKDAQNFQTAQTQDVKPTVESGNSLDIYA